jgi:hypothetical protein
LPAARTVDSMGLDMEAFLAFSLPPC